MVGMAVRHVVTAGSIGPDAISVRHRSGGVSDRRPRGVRRGILGRHGARRRKTLAPGFLIAVPQLTDPNFKQSVVLLLQQSDDGALGLVINRESPISRCATSARITRSTTPAIRLSACASAARSQPEQGLVLYSRRSRRPGGARRCSTDCRSALRRERFSTLCQGSGIRFHCFPVTPAGRRASSSEEINEGSWILAPVDPKLVLGTPPDDLWLATLVGDRHRPRAHRPRRLRRELGDSFFQTATLGTFSFLSEAP